MHNYLTGVTGTCCFDIKDNQVVNLIINSNHGCLDTGILNNIYYSINNPSGFWCNGQIIDLGIIS